MYYPYSPPASGFSSILRQYTQAYSEVPRPSFFLITTVIAMSSAAPTKSVFAPLRWRHAQTPGRDMDFDTDGFSYKWSSEDWKAPHG
jgi:hypothetical protein